MFYVKNQQEFDEAEKFNSVIKQNESSICRYFTLNFDKLCYTPISYFNERKNEGYVFDPSSDTAPISLQPYTSYIEVTESKGLYHMFFVNFVRQTVKKNKIVNNFKRYQVIVITPTNEMRCGKSTFHHYYKDLFEKNKDVSCFKKLVFVTLYDEISRLEKEVKTQQCDFRRRLAEERLKFFGGAKIRHYN